MNQYEEEYEGVAQEGQQDMQTVSFRRIEELEQYGVAKTDISKLKAGGFHTIESVRNCNALPSELTINNTMWVWFRLLTPL